MQRVHPQLLMLLSLAAVITGCAVRLPNATEAKAVETHQQAVVLVRVTGELSGEPFIPFAGGFNSDTALVLGLADFGTGGRMKQIGPRFLTHDTRKAGWLYFILAPGTHYLAVQALKAWAQDSEFTQALRWQIDVPVDTPVLYAGTIHLQCVGEKLLFGGRRLLGCAQGGALIHNEEVSARQVASGHIAYFGPLHTVLMQRPDSQTIILRTPKRRESP